MGEKKAEKGRRPMGGLRLSIGLILLAALFAVAADVIGDQLPDAGELRLGGYYSLQKKKPSRQIPIKVIDIHEVIGSRKTVGDPEALNDPRWTDVADRWDKMTSAVQRISWVGPRALVVDWQLALKDDYVSAVLGSFNDEMVPPRAQESYSRLIKSLLDAREKGIVVAVGADWARDQRLSDPSSWFLNPKASSFAATLEAPAASVGDYIATSLAQSKSSEIGLPSISDLMAAELGDRLGERRMIGFSPYRSRQGEPGAPKEFWVDFGLAPQKPFAWKSQGSLKDLRGQVVLLGALERREAADSVTIPSKGLSPGVYHHASAIATRSWAPLHGVQNEWAGAAVTFVIAVGFGLLALGVKGVLGLIRWPNPSDLVQHRLEAAAELIVLVFAIRFAWWQSQDVATHRLIFTMAGANLLGRVAEVSAVVSSLVRREILAKSKPEEPEQRQN